MFLLYGTLRRRQRLSRKAASGNPFGGSEVTVQLPAYHGAFHTPRWITALFAVGKLRTSNMDVSYQVGHACEKMSRPEALAAGRYRTNQMEKIFSAFELGTRRRPVCLVLLTTI